MSARGRLWWSLHGPSDPLFLFLSAPGAVALAGVFAITEASTHKTIVTCEGQGSRSNITSRAGGLDLLPPAKPPPLATHALPSAPTRWPCRRALGRVDCNREYDYST